MPRLLERFTGESYAPYRARVIWGSVLPEGRSLRTCVVNISLEDRFPERVVFDKLNFKVRSWGRTV